MSLVGPRPNVERDVAIYTDEDKSYNALKANSKKDPRLQEIKAKYAAVILLREGVIKELTAIRTTLIEQGLEDLTFHEFKAETEQQSIEEELRDKELRQMIAQTMGFHEIEFADATPSSEAPSSPDSKNIDIGNQETFQEFLNTSFDSFQKFLNRTTSDRWTAMEEGMKPINISGSMNDFENMRTVCGIAGGRKRKIRKSKKRISRKGKKGKTRRKTRGRKKRRKSQIKSNKKKKTKRDR